MYKRILDLSLSKSESCFLWGPRQTGKSTLLKNLFEGARYYDLLWSDTYRNLQSRPALIREELEADNVTGESQGTPVIIDEVQKIPELLDEVQWLIVNRGIRFILCGSSARKVKRGHANLLGGRAVHYELFPLVSKEIPDLNLQTALNTGLIPRIYGSDNAGALLSSYAGDYLKEEIAAEGLTRNIPAFSRFLEVASLSNGEILNFNNIARECGVSAPAVREYFQILEDTHMGRLLLGYRKRGKRRIISAPKFYYFDVGVCSILSRRGVVRPGSELFGKAFEHFIQMELNAWNRYANADLPISYWRTASGFEVDFILGDETAIEVKSSDFVKEHHLRGLRAFKEEFKPRRALAVSLDRTRRKTSDGIEIWPWKIFLTHLWEGYFNQKRA